MEFISEILTMIFKDVNINSLINKYDSKKKFDISVDSLLLDKNSFLYLAHKIFSNKTTSELELIYKKTISMCEERLELGTGKDISSIFNLIIIFSNMCLTEDGKGICYKYDNALKWRKVTQKLDQDIVITAYYAYKDILSSRKTSKFDWGMSIFSDNTRLNKILKEGISDNHFHLKGSAEHFYLSWVSLMNRVVKRNSEFQKSAIDEFRLDGEQEYIELREYVFLAAVIRLILFHNVSEKKSKFKLLDKDLSNLENNVSLKEILRKPLFKDQVQSEIYSLRYNFNEVQVDYAALLNNLGANTYMKYYSGERELLYRCFSKIFRENKKRNYKFEMLLYIYIVIKSKFRSEMVQVNDRIGFNNFQTYQNRKGKFLGRDKILQKEFIKSAVLGSVKSQNIKSFELRIVPEDKLKVCKDDIKQMDKLIKTAVFNDRDNYWTDNPFFNHNKVDIITKLQLNGLDVSCADKDIQYSYQLQEKILDKFYYVFHYPKRRDEISHSMFLQAFRCRHFNMREDLKKNSMILVKLRERFFEESKRVLGIDGCGDELICRPEVFSHSFRFLKEHFVSLSKLNANSGIPRLKITFHAGEDFYDIVDGIRAIDETVTLMDMKHGERIGHALSLGINVREWYLSKERCVILTKQYLIDNLAWLIGKIKEFSIDRQAEAISYLEPLFNKYFTEVYDNRDNTCSIDNTNLPFVDLYYLSMQLRGDDPNLYISGKFESSHKLTYWNRSSERKSCDQSIRKNYIASNLYYKYHFDQEAKARGEDIIEFKISDIYISVVEQIQKSMQKVFSQRGIAIECNPSSNYLIGNFRRYDKHPIVNFYNKNLVSDYNNDCRQMFVSINTDDQGVFGTLLENEYTLMSAALEKAIDVNGNRLYNENMVYKWIDDVRQMGLQQSFINSDRK
ncbi:hypothetical protein [Clostridium folliculivorans]|uniref:hypothetical protein n=1 Tax=Clostridium folliculivorans TaxID=2886038 RepID=UPI0021C44F3D|nr:hypothetical protein [Clostridium folliculivorans]GKU30441.1 hypothetical protein CFB3_25480 [Clostridium folliculivorans]